MAEQVGEIYYTVDFQTDRMIRKVPAAEKALDQLDNTFKKTDKSAAQLNTGLSTLAKTISAVIAASVLRDMANLVQSYQEMAERVQMATSSQAEFEMVQQRLLDTANGTYRSLAEAQELFIRTNASLQSMGYTTAQAVDVMDSLSYSFVTNATSAERADAAISAVSKSFNTGKVAADQWETITAAIPSVIEQIAAASGKSAAEVRALGAAGKLTAQDLSEGLRKSLQANSDAAAKMSVNLRDAGVRMTTALQVTLVALEKQTGALQTFTNTLVSAADMMIEFAGDSANIETVMNAITTAAGATAAIIAGRLLMSLGASTKALYASTIAARAKAAADLAAAQAATAAAAQELILATAAERAAVGLSTHAAAAARLTAAQAAATTTTAALGVAQQRMAGFATLAATAANGLRAAYAFIGGPAGVALLAAGAIYSFVSAARDAKPPTDDLTKSVNDLSQAQRDLAKIEATRKLEELGAAAKKLSTEIGRVENWQKIDEGFNSPRAVEALLRRKVALEGINGEIETYKKRLQDLENFTPSAPTTPTTIEPNLVTPVDPGVEKAADAVRDQVAALQQQADMLGMTETEAELYKLQLAGATDEQIRAAASSRALIDAYEQQADAEKAAADAAEEAKKKREAQRQTLGQLDPIAGEQMKFEEQLQQLRMLNEAKLIEDQRYLDLKAQAERAHDEQMRVLQEANFRRQSVANELLMASLDQLKQGATNALVGLVTGASNGEEAIRALAGSILNEAVGALVQMGVQQVKNLIMGQTAAAAATAAGVAQGSTLAAAYAPAAALASLASFGANAAPAQAGIAMTMATTKALAVAGGRQYGGPVSAGNMYRINENGAPEVFQASNGRQYMLPNTRGEVVSNKDATNSSSPEVAVYVNVHQAPERAGTVEQKRDEGGQVIDIFVADIMGNGKAAQTLQGVYGVRRQGK